MHIIQLKPLQIQRWYEKQCLNVLFLNQISDGKFPPNTTYLSTVDEFSELTDSEICQEWHPQGITYIKEQSLKNCTRSKIKCFSLRLTQNVLSSIPTGSLILIRHFYSHNSWWGSKSIIRKGKTIESVLSWKAVCQSCNYRFYSSSGVSCQVHDVILYRSDPFLFITI
jgi:hypothetical protein